MPTFGKTAVGGSWNTNGDRVTAVNKYTLTEDGSVTKLTAYVRGNAPAGTQGLIGVIYSDVAGTPTTLMGSTAELSVAQNQPENWQDMTFAAPVSLTAGTYWLGMISGTVNVLSSIAYDAGASGDLKYNINVITYPTPDSPFGTPINNSTELYSIYATYTAGGFSARHVPSPVRW